MRKHGGKTIAIRALRVAVCLALLAPLLADAARSRSVAAAFLGDTVNSGQILFLAVLSARSALRWSAPSR